MSLKPPKSGVTLVFARALAKPGKGDEVEKYLLACIENANSDKEPYTHTYRCGRHGDEFRLVEEYDQDLGGIEEHKKQKPFQDLVASGLVAEVEILFYDEIGKKKGKL
ncbi:putative quinol monooxygenase [Rhodotorula paludigena]|uniref:putative quinol monooxygenase n=1 Tax=Rhodotorula paludigena TaxID=86838 RepID=UPI00317525E3